MFKFSRHGRKNSSNEESGTDGKKEKEKDRKDDRHPPCTRRLFCRLFPPLSSREEKKKREKEGREESVDLSRSHVLESRAEGASGVLDSRSKKGPTTLASFFSICRLLFLFSSFARSFFLFSFLLVPAARPSSLAGLLLPSCCCLSAPSRPSSLNATE